MSENFFAHIRGRFPKDEGTTFIERADGRVISYGEMLAATGRLANAMAALGVGVGDRVAVQTEKSAEGLLLYLATLRLGAVYLPLNSAYTGSEVRYFLGDAEPSLFVCSPDRLIRDGSAGGGSLPRAGGDARHRGRRKPDGKGQRRPAEFPDRPRGRDDLAAILYTSGTTGRSKGAMLTHENLVSNAETLRDVWRFTAEDRLLHALPIFHTHGLFVATNVVLMAGASMILLPAFNADEVIRLLPKATAMMGVPTYYTRLLAHPGLDRDRVAHMRLFVSGSAPLQASTHKQFADVTGHAILERYGMTETGMNTSNPYDGERIAGSVGLPLPDVEIRIADPHTGRVLPQGEVGVIEIRGPNVFVGYWRMPEKTKEEFRADGFFVSGDLGFVDPNGYIFIVGRAKDLIISGGFNVYPAEVEFGDRGAAGRGAMRRDRRSASRLRGRRDRCRGEECRRRFGRSGPAAQPLVQACEVQAAEAHLRGRQAAAERDGQGAEEPASGTLRRGVRRMSAEIPLRRLGRSGLVVSRLALGTMIFGDRTDEAEARRIFDEAVAAGVNFIDTADNYAGGRSEEITGRLVAGDRHRFVLASKIANPKGDGPNQRGLSRKWIMEEVQNSLSRLGTDFLDILYLHKEDHETPLEETVRALADLQRAGAIRYFGVSNYAAWRIARICAICDSEGIDRPIASQPLYHALNRTAEIEQFPACAELGLGVVAYSPTARGVLSGKYAADGPPPADSRAASGNKRMLESEYLPENLRAAQAIAEYARSIGAEPIAFALAWALANPIVTAAIVGPRTLEQWRSYLGAFALDWTPDWDAAVNRLVPPGTTAVPQYIDPSYPVRGRPI